MSHSNAVQFRISPQEKAEVFAIFEELGLKPSQAIRLFFRQVKATRSIPFAIHQPNSETQQVLDEIERGENLVKCKNADDMFAKLGI